jgi:hypothetical protein
VFPCPIAILVKDDIEDPNVVDSRSTNGSV